MSGIEPGRPKIEEREAQYIWNGTRILSEHGVESTVTGVAPQPDGSIVLLTERPKDGIVQAGYLIVQPTDLIRCRVEDEDR
jgi:hypothetical protein